MPTTRVAASPSRSTRAGGLRADTFLFATIETNNDKAKEAELRAFLVERGYTFLGHAAVDDYFCHGAPPHAGSLSFVPPLDRDVPRRLANAGALQ